MSLDDEQSQAFTRIENMIKEFIDDNGVKPTKAYISDEDELQSWLMWSAMILKLKAERTQKKDSYLE